MTVGICTKCNTHSKAFSVFAVSELNAKIIRLFLTS
ncbi:hypothetical protein T01_15156 [Trichinella spiralis]|uniref:Uncharacterized protein n=1 Tax=Trichinella spiralis TaxID=6334 RepID=A0A0V0YYK1_TRISP|nr:hypothetical protein T01_15156 [Trichinella spiralis]